MGQGSPSSRGVQPDSGCCRQARASAARADPDSSAGTIRPSSARTTTAPVRVGYRSRREDRCCALVRSYVFDALVVVGRGRRRRRVPGAAADDEVTPDGHDLVPDRGGPRYDPAAARAPAARRSCAPAATLVMAAAVSFDARATSRRRRSRSSWPSSRAAFLLGCPGSPPGARRPAADRRRRSSIVVRNYPTARATTPSSSPSSCSLGWLGRLRAATAGSSEAAPAEERARGASARSRRGSRGRGGAPADRARAARRRRAHGQRDDRPGGRGAAPAHARAGARARGAAHGRGDRAAGADRDAAPARRPAPGATSRSALAPQPGIGDARARSSSRCARPGCRSSSASRASRSSCRPGVDLSAYRIVQEALTNALKHAGPARAWVVVRYGADQVELEVANDGRTERAAAATATASSACASAWRSAAAS